ncbi:MAG: PQQ-binding-like beta-propeller repeat protein, partial [Candidatus Aenigmatarchaeota archaeon]
RSPMQWNYTLSTAGVPDGTYDMSITVVHDLETWFRRPLKMTVNSTAWKVTFDDLSDKTFMLTTPVRSTPAVDSKRIYLAAENGTVYALNMDGSVAWSYFTGNLIRGSPAIARGRVYIGTQNGKLFSLSSILTADQTAPTYSNQRQSGDNVGVGGTLTLSVDAADDTALGSATLATDETGAWVKYTNKYGSSAALAGKSATASFTWSNSNIGEGKTVKWKVYIKDASGKETVTAEKSFKVVGDIEPPAATSVGQRGNTVVLGSSNELYAYWTDNSGLVKAELLIGGTKVDEVALEGKSGWSNFTYTPTTTGTVSWQIRAMDGSGNTGLSGAKNFETLLTAEDKTAPTAETPSVSATSVTAGEAVNIKVRAADNVGLKKAELEVNGRIVDSFDFAGAPTGEASFAYAPPAGGSYQMRVVLTDSAGNTISTSTFTVTAQAAPAITCTGIAPQPSVWTTCKIEGGAEKGTQSRIIYECDATTGIYRARTETRDCEAGFQPLPTVYIAVGLVLIVMAGASLLLWKRRMPKKEAAPATAPAPAETTQ